MRGAAAAAGGVALRAEPCRNVQKWDNADALLYICRQLWGLSIISPVYTLLLHQWLLLHKDAGGADQRQKHVSVVISGRFPGSCGRGCCAPHLASGRCLGRPTLAGAGARQLFWADVHSSASNFKPLFDFLATEVVHAPNAERVRLLPSATWAGLQSVVASFLPLYVPPQARLPAAASRRACAPSSQAPLHFSWLVAAPAGQARAGPVCGRPGEALSSGGMWRRSWQRQSSTSRPRGPGACRPARPSPRATAWTWSWARWPRRCAT